MSRVMLSVECSTRGGKFGCYWDIEGGWKVVVKQSGALDGGFGARLGPLIGSFGNLTGRDTADVAARGVTVLPEIESPGYALPSL